MELFAFTVPLCHIIAIFETNKIKAGGVFYLESEIISLVVPLGHFAPKLIVHVLYSAIIWRKTSIGSHLFLRVRNEKDLGHFLIEITLEWHF